MINLETIKQAQKNLSGVIHNTPLSYAPLLSTLLDGNIYLKKENLQLTGSFKLRGAFNKIASMNKEFRELGVVAASAGNHAQGVAFSAKYFKCDAIIIMPEATPLTKVNGVKSHGANVILHGANYDEAYAYAIKYAKDNNKTFVHPFEDDEVISGQGTIALEILDQLDDIDQIIIPIGGGGLVSGIGAAIKAIKPSIKIIGVVASGAPSMLESYQSGKAIDSLSVRTIADGIAVRDTSSKMLDLVLKYVDDIVEVEDKEIASAILFLLEQQKLVVEGAGAVGVAAMMHEKIDIKDKKTVSILSGGNIDVTMLSQIIEKGLVKSSRKMNLIVTLIDKPGSLMTLTEIFNTISANIVSIDYDRDSVALDFGDANITISLETKGEDHQDLIRTQLKSHGYRFKQL
ncbi:MAG: threonine ammonia-lyase [Campylobacterales bacterium]|nr:threonine ammonia-lyase [Campylobacterales bacterium]